MKLSNKIEDIHTAGQEWLRLKLEQDERDMKDYDRPLKAVREVSRNPFEKLVARHGFATACYKYVAP